MNGQIVRMAVAMLLVFGVSVAGAGTQKTTKAHKATKPQIQAYTGTVKVTKDKAGQVTAAKLSVGKILPHKYSIVLDKEGKELADKMDGKRVQVKGLLEKKSGKTTLLIKEYGVVPPKAKKTVAPKPAKTTAPKSTNGTTQR